MNWQLRIKVRNLRILVGILALVAVYAWLGKSDSDARLDESRRIQAMQSHGSTSRPVQRNAIAAIQNRGEI